jgi:hypothetical protein
MPESQGGGLGRRAPISLENRRSCYLQVPRHHYVGLEQIAVGHPGVLGMTSASLRDHAREAV